MKCPKCGKEIANDSAFCEYCGEPIKKNRKYAIRRTDVRWVLLIAMANARLGYICNRDWGLIETVFISSLVLLIVALVYGIKKLLPWSFVITMAALAAMQGALLCAFWYWEECLVAEFIVLIIYLIYAFIAYKKKWTF